MDISFISTISMFQNLLIEIFPNGFGDKIKETENLFSNEFLQNQVNMSNRGSGVSLDNSLMPNMLRIANSRALSTLFEGYR